MCQNIDDFNRGSAAALSVLLALMGLILVGLSAGWLAVAGLVLLQAGRLVARRGGFLPRETPER